MFVIIKKGEIVENKIFILCFNYNKHIYFNGYLLILFVRLFHENVYENIMTSQG